MKQQTQKEFIHYLINNANKIMLSGGCEIFVENPKDVFDILDKYKDLGITYNYKWNSITKNFHIDIKYEKAKITDILHFQVDLLYLQPELIRS